MIKIIENGKKEFVMTCSKCGCKFSYELCDVTYGNINCPECEHSLTHPNQYYWCAINNPYTLEDYNKTGYMHIDYAHTESKTETEPNTINIKGEQKMKKLFISVPMRGRTQEAINKSYEEMKKLAEIYFGEELAVINSKVTDTSPQTNDDRIYYLGQSISKMADADYFIGIGYNEYFTGCSLEYDVACRYGIPNIRVELHNARFLNDALEIERNHWNDRCVNVKA